MKIMRHLATLTAAIIVSLLFGSTKAATDIYAYEFNRDVTTISLYYFEGETTGGLNSAFAQSRATLQVGPALLVEKIELKLRLWKQVWVQPYPTTWCTKETVNYTCLRTSPTSTQCIFYDTSVTPPVYRYNWTTGAQVTYPSVLDTVDFYATSRHKLIDTRATNPNNNNAPPARFHTTDDITNLSLSSRQAYYVEGAGLNACTYGLTGTYDDDE